MYDIDYARQEFVQILSQFLDRKLRTTYQLVYPLKCIDGTAAKAMAGLESNFAFYARQLCEARVIDTSIVTDVKFDRNKRVVATMEVCAVIKTGNHKGVIQAPSFRDFAGGVVNRFFSSFKSGGMLNAHLSKKTAFEIMNKMVGDEVLYDLKSSIEDAVLRAHEQALRDQVREKAIESFRMKHRMHYTGELVEFLKNRIPPGLLEEEDFQRAWREFLVHDVMES